MTFYEAALEVLRRNERPLHFKKITEISIREHLLSHVGRDPATVMVERLQKDIERGDDSAVLEPRRGVFELKADVRNRLNEEFLKREQAEKNADLYERSLRRRPRGSFDGLSSAPSFPPVKIEEELLQKLAKNRYDTIEEAARAVLLITECVPVSTDQLAEIVFSRKLAKFHTHEPETTLKAALITANQVARRRHKLPPFENYSGDRWGLSEWALSISGRKIQQNLERLSSDLHRDTEKQLAQALTTLKPEAFEMVVMTLLELLDYTNVKVSKRTGSGDVLFTADWTRGFSSTRVCIQIVNNKDTVVDQSMISELRENLPHYAGEEGIVINLGKISQEAVEEAKKSECPKITLLGCENLVALLLKHGIGVRTYNQPVVMLDRLFFDSLS